MPREMFNQNPEGMDPIALQNRINELLASPDFARVKFGYNHPQAASEDAMNFQNARAQALGRSPQFRLGNVEPTDPFAGSPGYFNNVKRKFAGRNSNILMQLLGM